ncbi:hypothetical protein [Methanosarcina barkeri]|uniref:hypothetical protein n=1 Tax=Methanosarcina barkeri TaxID=2208 RepID=UPI0006D1E6E9|nr:hypothetical protein [Methanosarcina barkeri]
MKKSRIVQDLACFTIILTLLSLLPGGSLAARNSSDHGDGNQNQYIGDTLVSYNETDNVNEKNSSESDVKQEQKNLSIKKPK